MQLWLSLKISDYRSETVQIQCYELTLKQFSSLDSTQ